MLPISMFAANAGSLCIARATPNLLTSTVTGSATTSGLTKYGAAITALALVLNGCASMPPQPVSLQDDSEEIPIEPEKDKICQGPPYTARIDYGKTAKDWYEAERGYAANTVNFRFVANLHRFFSADQQDGERNLVGIRIIALEADITPKEFDEKMTAKGLRALTLNEAMQLSLQCTNVLKGGLFAAGSTIYDEPDYAVPNIYFGYFGGQPSSHVREVNRHHTYKLQRGWRIPVVPKSNQIKKKSN